MSMKLYRHIPSIVVFCLLTVAIVSKNRGIGVNPEESPDKMIKYDGNKIKVTLD